MSLTEDIKEKIKQNEDGLNYIADEIGHTDESSPAVWYSIENNTLGEAALVVIDDMGEQQFGGVFLT